jgi:hypothetical protein
MNKPAPNVESIDIDFDYMAIGGCKREGGIGGTGVAATVELLKDKLGLKM